MHNLLHRLLMPHAKGDVARLMQKLCRQSVGQFNARHRRTGTLLEGCYKACLVDELVYLLHCRCHIDLNQARGHHRRRPVVSPVKWGSSL